MGNNIKFCGVKCRKVIVVATSRAFTNDRWRKLARRKFVAFCLFLCCINAVALLFYCVLLFDTGQETVLQFTHKARWQDEIYLGQSTACAAATPCPRKRRQLGLGTSSHAEIKGQSFSRIYIAAPNHGKKNSSTKYVASFTKVYFQLYAQDGHG